MFSYSQLESIFILEKIHLVPSPKKLMNGGRRKNNSLCKNFIAPNFQCQLIQIP